MSNKDKFALYLDSETRGEIDYWYQVDNCASRTEFIEKAIKFYVGYLMSCADNSFLPTAISSLIEGRLDSLEDRVARQLFKQSVELAMLTAIIASDTDIDDMSLNRLRVACTNDVKKTNGRLRFEDFERGDE